MFDFECSSGELCRFLYQGFQRYRLLAFTSAPFYVDKIGNPRRAGSSIIKSALHKSCLGVMLFNF
jgi:hypothetical protein